MGRDLASKYRPKTYEEVIGQTNAIRQLQGEPTNVYILAGESGLGKTSISRIFANEINAELVEIDATSIGKADILTLKEKAYTRPMFKDYTLILIDEAHSLSSAAMDALLKPLEDGPAPTIWVFCTTVGHKVKDTLHTRARYIELNRVDKNLIVEHLVSIASEENAEVPLEVIEDIAKYSNGGVRTAVKKLETYIDTGQVDLPINNKIATDLTIAVYRKDVKTINDIVMDFTQHDIHQYIKFVSDYIIAMTVLDQEMRNGANSKEVFPLILDKYTSISTELIPNLRELQVAISSTMRLPNSTTLIDVAKSLTMLMNATMASYSMFGDNRYQLKAILATLV